MGSKTLFNAVCSELVVRAVELSKLAQLVVPVSLIGSNVYMSNLILFVLFYNR